ncbi:hypothetical protein V498_10682 [Pseudogymnoascus sp. VKM F-4517 (FW-2822)]|nr:hypothetical protein V498_10682 [Pseudogymnoascus sp. VKM F-4517 (FW-2822)]
MATESSVSFRVQDLRFEHRLSDALGASDARPRISWRVSEAPASWPFSEATSARVLRPQAKSFRDTRSVIRS